MTFNRFDKFILSPPPNVTGKFHLGHYFNLNLIYFLKEALTKAGYNPQVIAGWDHAGVSAENKIDPFRKLSCSNIIRRLRNISIHRIAVFKRQLDCWKITLQDKFPAFFSLEAEFQNQVLILFRELRSRGFIRSKKIFINVDSTNGKSLTDEEVVISKNKKRLYRLYFPSSEPGGKGLEVSTTLPLTVFSDVALCVHPEDKRYQEYIGKDFIVPGTNSVIKVFTHPSVDRNYGTGVIKITPSMDKNDAETLLSLPGGIDKKEACIDRRGNFSIPGKYQGLSWENAEKFFLRDLLIDGFLKGVDRVSGNSKSFRGRKVFDISREEVILDLRKLSQDIEWEKLEFTPKWILQELKSWAKRVDDWCLSRDVRWGTPIPDGGGQVLDTWFNATLWSLLLKEREFDYLVTGCDLVFFWYYKMEAISFFRRGKAAFKNTHFHGLVTDKKGQKMSKSRGNVMDPIELINNYGLDKMRLAVLEASNQLKSLRFDPSSVKISKLLNKIFNIGNFLKREGNYSKRESNIFIIRELWEKFINFKRSLNENFLTLRFDKLFDLIYEYFFRFSYLLEMFKEQSEKIVLSHLRVCFQMALGSIAFLIPESYQGLKINWKVEKFPPLINKNFEQEDFIFKLKLLFNNFPNRGITWEPLKTDKILVRIIFTSKQRRELFLIDKVRI